jgi:hypothetical protein
MQPDITLSECVECVMPTAEFEQTEVIQSLCVRCPFCLQTVNAIVTTETIACPQCKAVVKR